MGATQNDKPTGGGCSQEAEMLLEEFERLMYELYWFSEIPKEEFKRELFLRASTGLKNFIVRNVKGEEDFEMIAVRLRERIKEEEVAERRRRETQEMMNMVASTIKTASESKSSGGSRSLFRCFYCDRQGHRARDCYKRRNREEEDHRNKDSFKYSGLNSNCATNDDTEEGGKKKQTPKEKEVKEINDTMRMLEKLEREFLMVFSRE